MLRFRHWIKNFLIFAPLFFSQNLFNVNLLSKSIILFISFSLMASVVYCINDIVDLKDDRKHPTKKNRPLAAGKISLSRVIFLAIICGFTSLVLPAVFKINSYVYLVLLTYLLMNILYTMWLKKITLVDVFILAIGFVLRVVIGGVSCDIALSHWIIILSFMLALFLAITKRMNDVQIKESSGFDLRIASKGYTSEYLKILLGITGAVSIVTYIMYTLSEEVISRFQSKHLYISTIFVLLALFEFLNVTFIKKESGNPTEVFYKNRLIQIAVLGWILYFYLMAYM